MFRSLLFITTNISIMVLFTTILYFGVYFFAPQYLTFFQNSNVQLMIVISLIIGFTGSFITLFSSKWLAKRKMGLYVIETPNNETEEWLIENVAKIAFKAGIKMPEVAVFNGSPNAFATGWNRNNALVAFSDQLIYNLEPNELKAVIAHEIAHISNGDMVTMTLLQGIINTFVMFISWIAAKTVTSFISQRYRMINVFIEFMLISFFQVIFGTLASLITMWFSRHREYKADRLASEWTSPSDMYDALGRLAGIEPVKNTDNDMAVMGFLDKEGFMELFSTHPTIDKRRKYLSKVFS